ncbi:MAG: NAD(P)H-hydrate dehydratase [Chlamydiae bacterium]|nr:NAD(P)H-hydrate dehydratase [Chlamydiota bacterium]
MLEGLPVVTSKEMARIEKLAVEDGADEAAFMEKAGSCIADFAKKFATKEKRGKEIVLLIGKGNKGGDGFVAGRKLLQFGFKLHCFHLYDLKECSPLCQKQGKKFTKSGGKICRIKKAKEISFPKKGIIIDGLVGTGFEGKAEGFLRDVIEAANGSSLPILAIDIPSGLNGTTGEVGPVAISARWTVYLGLPKIGFFIQKGYDWVGKLVGADFGLDNKWVEKAAIEAHLIAYHNLHLLLPKIKRTRHKYETGYILEIAGSRGMSGAAFMTALAAMRSGGGILRLFYPKSMESEIGTSPLELLKEVWDLKNDERILIEAKRARSMIIGPGIGRSEEMRNGLKSLLEKIDLPMVLDADALFFLAENPDWKLPKVVILTPHAQEMRRLLQEEISLSACQNFAEKKRVTLLLKGAPTFIFHPGTKPLIMHRGDPGMATAGTGDVLTGIIGAFLAEKMDARTAAAVGATIHALSGELVAKDKTSFGMIASDLIEYLPAAFKQVYRFAGKEIP